MKVLDRECLVETESFLQRSDVGYGRLLRQEKHDWITAHSHEHKSHNRHAKHYQECLAESSDKAG
jgi:hypothetical protein